MIAGLDFTGPSKTLNGIAEATEDLNYTLIIKELHHFEYNVQPVLNWLHARHVDGIIWAVPEYGNNREWLCEYLPQTPVPIVFHDMAARPDTSIVYMDNYAGAEKATRHLLHQGYRHIGHISGSLGWYAAAQRKQAWQDTLAESGINFEERFWIAGDGSLASGASVIAPLLDQFPEPKLLSRYLPRALREDAGLRAGVLLWQGRFTHEGIAAESGRRCAPLTEADLA